MKKTLPKEESFLFYKILDKLKELHNHDECDYCCVNQFETASAKESDKCSCGRLQGYLEVFADY